MKKTLALALVGLVLLIAAGCRHPEERTLSFTNLSNEYDVEDKDFTVHYPEGRLPYVDAQSFFALIDGAIHYEKLSFKDAGASFEISYTEESEAYGTREYVLTLDAETDTATLNRHAFFSAFAVDTATDFGEGLQVIDFEENTPTSQTLDFGAYNFTLRKLDQDFLIPLHLANLMFTGNMYDVYYNGDELFGVDTYQIREDDIQTVLNDSTLNYSRMPKEIKEATYDYLLFSFDHFYGLKDVESYAGLFSMFEDDILSDIESHYKAVSQLAYSLDDLHTSHLMSGMYSRDLSVPLHHDDLGSETRDYLSRRNDMQSYCQRDERTYLGDGVAKIVIDSFDATTPKRFESHLEILKSQSETEVVLVDLSCNRGGIVGPMMQLFGYMSEEPIQTHRANTFDNHQTTRTIENDREPFDFEFAFLSSSLTFSAGNHMLAIAREMNFPIIGEPSRGGAASIKVNITPSGSVLMMSGVSVLTDSDYVSLEDGVDVDYRLDWESFSDETILIEILKNISD